MPDCLIIIVDRFADSVGLPVISHLKKKLTSLFSRQEYCILRLRSLESTVVRVVLKILQHLNSSNETCEVVLPLNARSRDSP